MKFKLDECVDARLSINLKQAGYEATTVHEQGLHGIEDERLRITPHLILYFQEVTLCSLLSPLCLSYGTKNAESL